MAKDKMHSENELKRLIPPLIDKLETNPEFDEDKVNVLIGQLESALDMADSDIKTANRIFTSARMNVVQMKNNLNKKQGEEKFDTGTTEGPFKSYRVGGQGVSYEEAKKRVADKMTRIFGSIDNVVADKGITDLEPAKNILKDLITNVQASMSKDPQVYRVMMDNVLHRLGEFFRGPFNQLGPAAFNTVEDESIFFERIKNSLGNMVSADSLDEVFVILDDEMPDMVRGPIKKEIKSDSNNNEWLAKFNMDDEGLPAEPNAVSLDDIEEPVAEDFGTKIKNIFSENFDKSYKQALKESLKNERI